MIDLVQICLYPRESECYSCGVDLTDCKRGIPCYEDHALPDDWEGGDGVSWPADFGREWGGFDVCNQCADIQSTITEPMHLEDMARWSRLGNKKAVAGSTRSWHVGWVEVLG